MGKVKRIEDSKHVLRQIEGLRSHKRAEATPRKIVTVT